MAEGTVAADQLRLFIERIERLEEEKKGIGDDIATSTPRPRPTATTRRSCGWSCASGRWRRTPARSRTRSSRPTAPRWGSRDDQLAEPRDRRAHRRRHRLLRHRRDLDLRRRHVRQLWRRPQGRARRLHRRRGRPRPALALAFLVKAVMTVRRLEGTRLLVLRAAVAAGGAGAALTSHVLIATTTSSPPLPTNAWGCCSRRRWRRSTPPASCPARTSAVDCAWRSPITSSARSPGSRPLQDLRLHRDQRLRRHSARERRVRQLQLGRLHPHPVHQSRLPREGGRTRRSSCHEHSATGPGVRLYPRPPGGGPTATVQASLRSARCSASLRWLRGSTSSGLRAGDPVARCCTRTDCGLARGGVA
jgi:hypothetical protein